MRVNDTLTLVNCRNVSEISSFYFFEINLFLVIISNDNSARLVV